MFRKKKTIIIITCKLFICVIAKSALHLCRYGPTLGTLHLGQENLVQTEEVLAIRWQREHISHEETCPHNR